MLQSSHLRELLDIRFSIFPCNTFTVIFVVVSSKEDGVRNHQTKKRSIYRHISRYEEPLLQNDGRAIFFIFA